MRSGYEILRFAQNDRLGADGAGHAAGDQDVLRLEVRGHKRSPVILSRPQAGEESRSRDARTGARFFASLRMTGWGPMTPGPLPMPGLIPSLAKAFPTRLSAPCLCSQRLVPLLA